MQLLLNLRLSYLGHSLTFKFWIWPYMYLMKVIPETCSAQWIRYLLFYFHFVSEYKISSECGFINLSYAQCYWRENNDVLELIQCMHRYDYSFSIFKLFFTLPPPPPGFQWSPCCSCLVLSCVFCCVCPRPLSCVPKISNFSGLSLLIAPLVFPNVYEDS